MNEQLSVAVTRWAPQDALSDLVAAAFVSLGCQVTTFLPSERFPNKTDLILIFGPFGSLAPIANRVLEIMPGQRPRVGVWLTEGLPRPDFPEWLRLILSRNRSWVERISYQKNQDGLWTKRNAWQRLTKNGFRYRYYGDLHWLSKHGLLDILATGSQWIAAFLRDCGFEPVVAYYGLQAGPEWGETLNLARTLPVLWLGKIATQRRYRLLKSIQNQLLTNGVRVKVVDGQENPAVHGRERTLLLNQTKIVLNLLRQPWDNNSIRFFLSSLNKALVISEPTYPHLPFQNQVHYIETSPDQIVPQILFYLKNDQERNHLAENAYRLVNEKLSIAKGAAKILEQVLKTR